MKCDLFNEEKNLFNTVTLRELIDKLEILIVNLKRNNNKEIEKRIVNDLRKEVNNYRKWFKKQYPDINNLCIYPIDKPFLYVCSIVDELKNETKRKFDLIMCLEMCKEILIEEFSEDKGNHISFEEEIAIIYLAQEKFGFLDVLNTSNDFFNLYNFPFIGKVDTCHVMAREYDKNMYFEFSLYDQAKDDKDNTLLYTTLLGRILNYVLVNSLYECPYGMMRMLNLLGIEYLEKEKDGGPIIFSSLFAIALFYETKYER